MRRACRVTWGICCCCRRGRRRLRCLWRKRRGFCWRRVLPFYEVCMQPASSSWEEGGRCVESTSSTDTFQKEGWANFLAGSRDSREKKPLLCSRATFTYGLSPRSRILLASWPLSRRDGHEKEAAIFATTRAHKIHPRHFGDETRRQQTAHNSAWPELSSIRVTDGMPFPGF